jgi:hypothetical protein
MRRCSNDLVAFIFQGIPQSVILKVLISTHLNPLQFLSILLRNAVRLHLTLEFQNLAHHCTRIMHLKNIFDSNGNDWFCFAILSGISFDYQMHTVI